MGLGDGRVHYVDIGRGDAVAPIPEGVIVRVPTRGLEVREADRGVAQLAVRSRARWPASFVMVVFWRFARTPLTIAGLFAAACLRSVEAHSPTLHDILFGFVFIVDVIAVG
ncbi:DUF3363 domain-containing protein [Novosphingobium album (ex Liu et al. 2023)]|uniref:DUF3363 domain-containing protein n=1 Tax=Novosphingobium album (ex Liu et al. 2023) TaxID=3031130 RepID=UPI003D183C66